MPWQATLGIVTMLAIAWSLSENRKAFPWRIVLIGIAMQLTFALLLLRLPILADAIASLNHVVVGLERATRAGSAFVFGYLGGADLPFEATDPGAAFIVAFQVLPIIVVISALSSLLFHWGVLQYVVRLFSKLLSKTLGIGGAASLGVAANVFLGIIEAPLFVRPYLAKMNRSDLFTLLTSGMATVAGTVMVLYAGVLSQAIPNAAGQIVVASLMSAPAAIMFSRIMIPAQPSTSSASDEYLAAAPSSAEGGFDALVRGANEGVQVVLGIIAILIVMFACVSILNQLLSWIPGEPTVQSLFGVLFTPFCWLMGLSWEEALVGGRLMGTKVVLNEFVAYLELSKIAEETLSEKSRIILMYAMCGFANFGSLGILVGGLGTILPERRAELNSLAARAVLSGVLSTMLTGSLVAVLFSF